MISPRLKSSLQFLGLLLLVIVFMGINAGWAKFHFDEPISYFIGYLPVPMVFAFIIYKFSLFQQTNFPSFEEKLFRHYYTISFQRKSQVITALLLLAAVPLMIAYLLVRDYGALLWNYWHVYFLLILYLSIVTGYASLIFKHSRTIYKKYSPALFLVVIGPVMIAADWLDLEVDLFTLSDWLFILSGAGMIAIGAMLLIKVSGTIADKKAQSEAELKFAGEVQQKFLQSRSCSAGGIQSYGLSQPAADLGGDFFHLSAQTNRLIAAVGDVSGHSYGAGLIMVMLKTAFEDHLPYHESPDEVLRILNEKLLNQAGKTTFATLGILSVDVGTYRAALWSAGHMPLIHYMADDEQIAHRNGKGFALGIRKDIDVVPCYFSLSPGDRLLMYSDGLVETRNDDQTVRGLDDFFELTDSLLPTLFDPKQIAAELLARIEEQHAYEVRDDDATVIALHRTH
ncbi:MAG: PP2C family protein-serine/threonine phosphatase [Balneolaceae bacterium]